METEIYFIRHAQSRPSSRVYHTEWPLSERGVEQAGRLAQVIADFKIEKVISSPFVRCLDTVRPFVGVHQVPMIIHEDLRERHVFDQIVDNYREIWLRSWDDFEFKMPGCESSHEAQQRFVTAVNEVVDTHRGQTIAISTHGNVLGLFLNHVDSNNHLDEAEAIRNPDILRVTHGDSGYSWDSEFEAPGLDRIATDHHQTPIDR